MSEHFLALTGLSSKKFDTILSNINLIDVEMSREVDPHLWKAFTPSVYLDNPTLYMSNRLLTPASHCARAETMPIPKQYDPNRVLQTLTKSGEYKYLPENDLKLYKKNLDGR